MKRFLYILLSFALTGAVVGCSDDDTITPDPEEPIANPLVYEVDQVIFGSQKSEKIITLTNIESDDFLVTKPLDDKWLSFEKGEGNTIVVSVKANASDIRESKITAQSGLIVEEIPIWQDAPRSIKFPQIPDLRGTGGSTTFGFTANIAAPFEVNVAEADQSWLKVTVDGDAKTVTAVAGQNVPKAGDRTGTFTISGYSEFGDFVETEVSVTQVGIDRPNYKFTLPEFKYSYPLSDPQPRIYKVMVDGQQIAEICLEWLGNENAADDVTVDAQAVVVYPMASDGKADLTKGYVAKIVKANTGKAYTYAAPTTAVHGGSISWDVENNCIASYTAGTEAAPVETVVIPADNFVFTAETFAEMTELSTEPYVVNDNRPNDTPRTYTVVKVGTQYWLGEYLKAKSFTDGTQIPSVNKDADWTAALVPRVMSIDYVSGSVRDIYNPDKAETVEAQIQKSGGLAYNFNCINKVTLPEDTTYKTYWKALIDKESDGIYDLPADGDMLAPTGWMVPSNDQVLSLKSYVDDATKVDFAIIRPSDNENRTLQVGRTRRIRDVSNWPDYHSLDACQDQNITGLGLTLTPRFSGSSFARPLLTNNWTVEFVHLLTRSLKYTSSDVMFRCYTLQNGSYLNDFYNVQYGMLVRCIRK